MVNEKAISELISNINGQEQDVMREEHLIWIYTYG